MKRELILASASPRRREILTKTGFTFEVRPADVDESRLPGEDAADYPLRTAMKKALAVAGEVAPGPLVIAADTVVVVDDDLLGKPGDEAEARAMLRRLSGREHVVITGIGIVDTVSRRSVSAAEQTLVWFHPLSDGEIASYVATGESLDKAGAYGIQERGALLVRKIDGDYFNVMGLPVSRLARLLSSFEEEDGPEKNRE